MPQQETHVQDGYVTLCKMQGQLGRAISVSFDPRAQDEGVQVGQSL